MSSIAIKYTQVFPRPGWHWAWCELCVSTARGLSFECYIHLLFLFHCRGVFFVHYRCSHVLKSVLPSHGSVALLCVFWDRSHCISMGFRMKQEKSWDFCKPIPSSVFCELGKLSVCTENILAGPATALLLRGFLQGQLKSCSESLNKAGRKTLESREGSS